MRGLVDQDIQDRELRSQHLDVISWEVRLGYDIVLVCDLETCRLSKAFRFAFLNRRFKHPEVDDIVKLDIIGTIIRDPTSLQSQLDWLLRPPPEHRVLGGRRLRPKEY